MLVGVCCECQRGGQPLRYERGRAIIDSHDAFGSFCQGSGTAPQATYDDRSQARPIPNGPNHFPVGPERTSEHNSWSQDIYPDDQDQKNPVVVGTLGALILAAKNGKQKTKRG